MTKTSRDFREASEQDIPALTALINEAYALAEGFFHEGPRIAEAEVREKLQLGSFLLDVDAEGAAWGCVYLTVTTDSGYLGLLAVSPARQRQGLGRALALAAEALGRSKGCRTMSLYVVNHRPELVPFYAALGYDVVGEEPFEDERLKSPAHFVVMRKALEDPR